MRHATAPPPSPESLTASQFARRERIVKVALDLLVNGDYEKIQMKDVAEASDVALGTVYRYFTSKEHLFAAVQIEWVKSLHRQILRRPPTGESNRERLSQILHKSVRAFQLQPQFYRVLLVLEVAKDPFAKELYEVMSRETEATYRESLSGIDPKTAADLLRALSTHGPSVATALRTSTDSLTFVGRTAELAELAAKLNANARAGALIDRIRRAKPREVFHAAILIEFVGRVKRRPARNSRVQLGRRFSAA